MQIFYLETNEEVTTIIERIRSSDQQELALVAPAGALLLQSIVNLKLIKREAEKLDRTLFLVTTDKIGRNLASQVGLTVYERIEKGRVRGKTETDKPERIDFSKNNEEVAGVKIHRYYSQSKSDQVESTKKATEKIDDQVVRIIEPTSDRQSKRSQANNRFLKKILLGLIIIGFLLAAAYGIWALPIVSLDIKVKAENLDRNSEIALTANGDGDSLKGRLIEAEKSASKKINATGSKDIGEKAKGEIVIYNEYSSGSQPLQAGTRMQTSDNKIYRLDGDVVVPGGEFEVEGSTARLTKAGSVSAKATADQPGDSYNISAATLTIPGIGRDDKIYAKTSGFSGGLSKTVKVVSVSDIADARIDLTNDLTGKVQEEINNRSTNLTVIESSLEKNLTSFNTDQQVNVEVENFNAAATIKIRLLAYSKTDLVKLITNKVTGELSPDQNFILNESDLKIEAKDINLNEAKAGLKVNFQGKVVVKINEKDLQQKLRGQSFSQISDIVKSLPQISDFKIATTPSWWLKRVPLRQKSLVLEIKYE